MAAKNIDSNQTDIALAARTMGASVFLLHEVGRGVPDLLIGFKGRNFLWEVKDANKLTKAQARDNTLALNDMQKKFFKLWRGQATVITSVDDVIYFLQQECRA